MANPNPKASPAPSVASRAPRRRVKASPRDGEKNPRQSFAARLHAIFRSVDFDYELVVPPRRGKKRARPVPYIKLL